MRATWRRSYRCDCDGESHRLVGREENAAIVGQQQYYADVTGQEAHGCPWRAMYEPIVHAIVELHRAAGDAGPASILPLDPPAHLWEGLMLYRKVRDLTRAQTQREEDAERKRG